MLGLRADSEIFGTALVVSVRAGVDWDHHAWLAVAWRHTPSVDGQYVYGCGLRHPTALRQPVVAAG
ncbi:hypothetical protein GCM10023320_74750 [Pseudonocardia adelaidensis]|uniref:Uncharacterized protein n=1 Tax=Pseudonocardia adelaidensis TaxID=648754 RepID=A0ABP9P277_9PSEU